MYFSLQYEQLLKHTTLLFLIKRVSCYHYMSASEQQNFCHG